MYVEQEWMRVDTGTETEGWGYMNQTKVSYPAASACLFSDVTGAATAVATRAARAASLKSILDGEGRESLMMVVRYQTGYGV